MNIGVPPYLAFLLSLFNTGKPREGQNVSACCGEVGLKVMQMFKSIATSTGSPGSANPLGKGTNSCPVPGGDF